MVALLRVLAGVVGIALVAIGLLAVPAENQEVQSFVLNLWTTFTVFGEGATSRHARLVRGTARMALAALDWVFGPKLLTLRCIWTATWATICSGWISLFLLSGLLLWAVAQNASWVPQTLADQLRPSSPAYPYVIFGGVGFSLPFLLVALWPALLRRPLTFPRTLLALVPLLMLAWRQWKGPHLVMTPHEILQTPVRELAWAQAAVGLFIFLGVLVDLGTLRVTRWALRKCESADRWRSGLAALGGLIPLGFVLSGAPAYVFRHVGGWYFTAPILLLLAAIPMSLFDVLFTVGLALWIVVLVAHKLLWPVICRLIERVYDLVPSRKGMVVLGIAVLALSGWDLVKEVLKQTSDALLR